MGNYIYTSEVPIEDKKDDDASSTEMDNSFVFTVQTENKRMTKEDIEKLIDDIFKQKFIEQLEKEFHDMFIKEMGEYVKVE